jgi:hypothetical protein
MDPERWRRVEELYHAAQTRAVHERAAFLAEACAGDDALRRQIESQLTQPRRPMPSSPQAARWPRQRGSLSPRARR